MTRKTPAKSVDGRRILPLLGEKPLNMLSALNQTLRRRGDGVNRMQRVSFSRITTCLLICQRLRGREEPPYLHLERQ